MKKMVHTDTSEYSKSNDFEKTKDLFINNFKTEINKTEVIRANNIGVMFKKAPSKRSMIAKNITSILKRSTKLEDFWALKNINFSVEEGDVLGVIGNNGAGKSTLLKLLVEVLYPDTGTLEINGKISSLLSLGAGFDLNLTGRENIFLSGMYLGLNKKKINKKLDQIIEFAELEDFIDTQIRYYSSGMKTRLGFSVAVHVDPEILVIDEVLAAGDKNFRKKAEEKMKEFIYKAKAIVIASHSTVLISEMCNKCIWLDNGRIKLMGSVEEVVEQYLNS